jgi:integrase
MGRKRTPGLYKRGGLWYIDKQVNRIRISESTGTCQLEEAERYLARRIELIRQATVYGIRPRRTFSEAAAKYLYEYSHKKSINWDIRGLKILDEFIGHLSFESINMGALQLYIDKRRRDGVKNRTINQGLQVTRLILNLAASEWMDEFGLTWLANAPKIKLLPQKDARKAYPLDWDEQGRLFTELSAHLSNMALFAVNTGCRDQEVCSLRWSWEVKIHELRCSVFIIPGRYTKNGDDRLVVLNNIAQSVINNVRGMHSEYVFVYKNMPLTRMNNKGWRRARSEVGLSTVRVHDLKHTFGSRLRAVGVSFEDRQDLLGHKAGRITTHYSAAEVSNLIEAANRVCIPKGGAALTVIKHFDQLGSVEIPQRDSILA